MNWIDMEDDLPEFGRTVLCYDKYNSFVSVGRLIECDNEENSCFELMWIDGVEGDSMPTHWMPLPEKPNG